MHLRQFLRPRLHRPRASMAWALIALMAATLLVAACDDDDDDDGILGDDTPAAGAETPGDGAAGETPTQQAAAQQTPGAGQTPTPGATATPSDGTPAATPAGGTPEAGEAAYGIGPAGSPTPGPTAAAAGEGAAGQAIEANIGAEAPEDLIDEWNIDITPTGEGLPEGEGTVDDGAQVYAENCARCHGQQGEGTDLAPLLVLGEDVEPGPYQLGDPRTVANYWPYLTTYMDYIRRAMPFDNPGVLSDDDLYAVTAWILNQNGMIEDGTTLDADAVMEMNELPNHDSFFQCYPDGCRPEDELTGQ